MYTTINLNMQRLARNAIAEVLNQPEDPASAIVTLNPANGDIEAMAESESYEQSQYNLAADGHRQPGSTFKAIDLADALSRGIDPNSTIYDSHTLQPGWLPGYPTYEVKTFGGEQNGPIDLVQATVKSDNTVYAQLAADLGEETITEMAYKLGVKTHLSSFPAEALGGLTLGVTPLEMADVYATLADGGWRNAPIAITRVVFPDGHVDTNWGRPHRVKVLSDGVTAEETNILHQNVLGGTATRSAINCPTAAKTGTTSELVDAWLDGYTPRYSTVVWMGYPNRRVPMTSVHGEAQQGGALPAEIWHTYMSAVTEGQSVPGIPAAQGIALLPAVLRQVRDDRAAGERRRIAVERKHGHPQPRTRACAHIRKRARTRPGAQPPSEAPRAGARLRARRSTRPGAPRRERRAAEAGRVAATSHSATLVVWTGHKRRSPGMRADGNRGLAKEDKVEFEGEVIEALPNAMFRVKLDNDHVVLGHVAGKMRRFRIRILPGDRVRCELSPYDLDRARIVYRHR